MHDQRLCLKQRARPPKRARSGGFVAVISTPVMRQSNVSTYENAKVFPLVHWFHGTSYRMRTFSINETTSPTCQEIQETEAYAPNDPQTGCWLGVRQTSAAPTRALLWMTGRSRRTTELHSARRERGPEAATRLTQSPGGKRPLFMLRFVQGGMGK
jgi:hypothetical protein